MDKFIKDNSPKEIHIIPTFSCDKRCKFCYQTNFENTWLELSKLELVLKGIKKNFEPRAITFQGGEMTTLGGFDYFELADKYFPQTYRKSLTTNGFQKLEYYKKLKLYGITHISFSYNEIDFGYEDKIKALSRDGFYNTRMNVVMYKNNAEFLRHIYNFAKHNNIQLTFCEDLRKPPDYCSIGYLRNVLSLKDIKIVELGRYTKIITDSYIFWICKYTESGRNDSLIILPNGTLSMKFESLKGY
jgi:MoaA/NifB/PqqE/SkfB family radical SAM enzyme